MRVRASVVGGALRRRRVRDVAVDLDAQPEVAVREIEVGHPAVGPPHGNLARREAGAMAFEQVEHAAFEHAVRDAGELGASVEDPGERGDTVAAALANVAVNLGDVRAEGLS